MDAANPDRSAVERKHGRIAAILTILLHAALLIASMFLALRTPKPPAEAGSIMLLTEQPLAPAGPKAGSRTAAADRRVEPKNRKASGIEENAQPPADIFDSGHRQTGVAQGGPESRNAPKLLAENELAPRQAVDELLALLDKHPEYKNLLLREAFAGDGMDPDRVPKLDLRLEELLKMEKWKSSWEYELMKRGGGAHTGPYDPVFGYDRDKITGLQVNIPELLKFLKKLLGAAKD